MANNDDGHSPETCNYQHCGATAGAPCPFVKDASELVTVDLSRECDGGISGKHEWRQLDLRHDTVHFYCIFCKKIEQ